MTKMNECNAIGCKKTAEMKCKCRMFIIKTNTYGIYDVLFCRNCYLKQKAIEYEHQKVESK